jgi:transposase
MTEQQLIRQAKQRLAMLQHAEEVTGNVGRRCRYYGISRQCFYTWKRRSEDDGLDGLRDRSGKPHFSPSATHTAVVGKIVYLRQHYHFGPLKISMYLARYHDIEISPSGVYRILKRLDLNRLPANQRNKTQDRRWKRYEKSRPGHHVQIDVKFIDPVAGAREKRYYQSTAIDDCTRLRVLRIYPKNNQLTAIQFLDDVLERLPFQVEAVQTDNGAEFQSKFHWHVLDLGIRHIYIKPRTPPIERQGRAIPPNRQRRVLPNARTRRRDRRRPSAQRQAPRMGGFLQLQPTPRRTRWTNAIRTTTTEDNSDLDVTSLRQLHS